MDANKKEVEDHVLKEKEKKKKRHLPRRPFSRFLFLALLFIIIIISRLFLRSQLITDCVTRRSVNEEYTFYIRLV